MGRIESSDQEKKPHRQIKLVIPFIIISNLHYFVSITSTLPTAFTHWLQISNFALCSDQLRYCRALYIYYKVFCCFFGSRWGLVVSLVYLCYVLLCCWLNRNSLSGGFKAAIFSSLTRKWSINISKNDSDCRLFEPVQRLGAFICHFVPSALLFTTDMMVFFSFCLSPQETSGHCCSRGCCLYPSQTDRLSALFLPCISLWGADLFSPRIFHCLCFISSDSFSLRQEVQCPSGFLTLQQIPQRCS